MLQPELLLIQQLLVDRDLLAEVLLGTGFKVVGQLVDLLVDSFQFDIYFLDYRNVLALQIANTALESAIGLLQRDQLCF